MGNHKNNRKAGFDIRRQSTVNENAQGMTDNSGQILKRYNIKKIYMLGRRVKNSLNLLKIRYSL